MIDISFYKEFYFKEIERKNVLDSKVSLPILVLSILVSIHVFILSKGLTGNFLLLSMVLSTINGLAFFVALFFLTKSYSNLFYSHWYKELPVMNDILTYEKKLEKEGLKNKSEILEEYLKRELADCASENFNLNKKRTENLAKCKQWMFINILFTAFLVIVYAVFLL
ncbi:MAG: hypothetical protein CMH48_02785 [Muricauda sp.]|nr:hypothetical protein [Allomuricauda sp.]MAU25801.1 hypothetical protein [Allomuricauda sp.]MBC29746.1 hypothetical protein [Allomuricauda sp.]|tara:strand:- start:757 stop:1257 length:501 start_codon:yes stop_codon:yes gene_type:complete